MKTNFKLSISFALQNGNEIQYKGEWSGEKSWELEKNWIELRVGPIDMAQEESPDSLANLLIDNLGQGPFYEHKPILNAESEIIKQIKAIPSIADIVEITVRGILTNDNGACWDRLFEYSAEKKIMIGTANGSGDEFTIGDRYGDLTFTGAYSLTIPRNAQQDGTYKGIFYNETEDEQHQRLLIAFNEKMEAFDRQYGNAKDAFLANLKRFKSYPDVERAKEIMDYDAKIEFPNKYILVYGCPESFALSREIEKRGGFYRDRAVKMANYFVLWDPDDLDGYHHSAIEKMLTFRDRGGEAIFVTAYQLWKALNYNSSPLSEEEIELLSLEREEERILAEMDKIREMIAKEKEEFEAKRKKEEERLQKKVEKEEAQREERERKEKEKAEKAQARLLASQAEQERKDEILKRKAAKQEEQRIAQQIAEKAREKKKIALEESRANATILYAPGQEPEKIKKRIETLLEKLDDAYPDHVIVRLGKNHKKWSETITELYRLLGYADNRSFLEAYGFTIGDDTGGRPSTLDPDSIIEELMKRYPQGLGSMTMAQVKQENTDLKIKTLENNAFNLFGETLAKHLKKCWANKSKESKEQKSKSSTPTVQTKEDTSMNLDFDLRDLADFTVADLDDLDLDDDI